MPNLSSLFGLPLRAAAVAEKRTVTIGEINFSRCCIIQTLVAAFMIVELEVAIQAGKEQRNRLVVSQIDVFILDKRQEKT